MNDDKRTYKDVISVVREKGKSPYAKLIKWYGYLNALLLLLCIFAAIGALCVTLASATEETTSQKLMMWLSAALLFLLPCIVHSLSILYINLNKSNFPILGITNYGKSELKKGPYLAFFGFIISGVCCLIVAAVPKLHSAVELLPLGWLYLPVMMVVTVIIPFIIWLILSVLTWRARNNPLGP